MKRLGALLLILLSCAQAQASATRILPADSFISADTTKSYPLPSVAGTLTGSGNFVAEAPSGTINGSNTAFSLANTPISSVTVKLYLDGVYLIPTTDYTISGSSITMVLVPATGQSLRATYVK